MRRVLIAVILAFTAGWVLSSVSPFAVASEQPFSFFFGQAPEIASPSDHVKQEDIHIFRDGVELKIKNTFFASYTDTNSMDPFLDKGANGIEIVPDSPAQIQEGDIISYKTQYARGITVHRVIKKGFDEDGVYFIVKGDNNISADPGKIRFDQVHGLLVGIIY